MITEHQIGLVQSSFEAIQQNSEVAADMFYSRLFHLDPTLRPMFRSDLKDQGRKLMHMLAIAVKGLSHLDQIVPAVEQLGFRHAAYGVRDEHYGTVAQALLWTLDNAIGAAFTPQVRQAWEAAYGLLANAMQRGAARVAPVMPAAYAQTTFY